MVSLMLHPSARYEEDQRCWFIRDPQDILDECDDEEVYDRPEGYRQRIDDLANYPMEDEAGRYMHVYDKHGHRHPRRLLRYPENMPRSRLPPACGILFNLDRLPEIFERYDAARAMVPVPGGDQVDTFGYPMASTRLYGHYQGNNGVPAPINRVRHQVAMDVRRRDPDDLDPDEEASDEEDDFGYDANDLSHPAVEGVMCQGYNVFSHRVRPQGARFQVAQQGWVTQVLAGSHYSSKKD